MYNQEMVAGGKRVGLANHAVMTAVEDLGMSFIGDVMTPTTAEESLPPTTPVRPHRRASLTNENVRFANCGQNLRILMERLWLFHPPPGWEDHFLVEEHPPGSVGTRKRQTRRFWEQVTLGEVAYDAKAL